MPKNGMANLANLNCWKNKEIYAGWVHFKFKVTLAGRRILMTVSAHPTKIILGVSG